MVAVRQGNLDVFPHQMDDGVAQMLRLGLILQEVEQAVAGKKGLAVEVDFQPGIEVGIVPKLRFDVLRPEAVIFENV